MRRPDDKVIGIFSSEKLARNAAERIHGSPGFADEPAGFITIDLRIDEYRADEESRLYD
ncbi:hypothetical protein [Xylanimonas sp. McL0601]|uniref:hypothetical protein n=1 Tax=Xylanimonas sp. McL0601 TaxID=3414739 RepID=UPI003CEF6BB5